MTDQPPKRSRRSAQVKGGGAVAQGKGAQAAGARGVVAGRVDGSVNTGDHYGDNLYLTIMAAAAQPGADAQTLRNLYLAWVRQCANDLPLMAGDSGQPVQLASVYTALLTHGRGDSAILARKGASRRVEAAQRESALEALDQERLLVLLGGPGSGKTTFLNFVALCMAGELQRDAAVNLKLLRTPIPAEPGKPKRKEKPKAQRWRHGALLPVRVVLRDFAADLPAEGEPIDADTLLQFIVKRLPESLRTHADALQSELLSAGGLILLDGLDEVPDAKSRRVQVKQAVQQFAGLYQNCRFLVTSRTYAYQHQDWKLNSFAERELLPFTRGQIQRFVDTWYAHLSALCRLSAMEAQNRAEALKRASGREALRELAGRPLLLTLMARLQSQGGGVLPENREEIYAQSVAMLLDQWERTKPRPRDVEPEPSLGEWLNARREDIRKELERLAYEAHLHQPDLVGTADIRQGDLITALLRASKNQPDVKVKRLEEYLRDRAGLLASHGEELYQFPHRSFQEYLAACHLARVQYPDQLSALVRSDPNRWREVALLAAAGARRTPSAIWELVETLCGKAVPADAATEPDHEDQWGALLAGQILHETGLSRPDPELAPRHEDKRRRVRDWQLRLLRSAVLPARERALAGDHLASLGDPRQYLLDVDHMRLVAVPRGPFWMGDAGRRGARLHCNEALDYDYWIAQAPVTVAQFRQFVEASGYGQHDPDSLKAPENRPVVNVSWYHAAAFCAWLDTRWRERLPAGWQIGLPSESEWEKATRGGLHLPQMPLIGSLACGIDQMVDTHIANPLPRRRYPWGDDFDIDRVNCEGNVGAASTPACFERGRSPYGADDMAGNVWEWTRSAYRPYPYDPADEREAAKGNKARVLRGGSWDAPRVLAGCAVRFRVPPDLRFDHVGFRVVLRCSPGP